MGLASYTSSPGIETLVAASKHIFYIPHRHRKAKQNQNARNDCREKEREPEQETRGDAEEPTETRRSPRQQAVRWRGKAKPTGRRKVPRNS